MKPLVTFAAGLIAGALLLSTAQASVSRPSAPAIPTSTMGVDSRNPERTTGVPEATSAAPLSGGIPSPSPATETRPALVRTVEDRKPSSATTPRPTTRPVAALSGLASWFSAPDATAAAGPRLRAALGAHWRNQRVRVTAGERSVVVVLRDWCRCPDGRVIDLAASSFARLAPLASGLVRVRVTVIGRIVPPATDR